VKKTYLYTNNHFSAKSVANAAMIKRQLDEPLPGNAAGVHRTVSELSGVVTSPAPTSPLTPSRQR
jgi:hypothetical protein